MAQLTIIHGDAAQHGGTFDLILTDPPYDMPGADLARIIDRYDAPHLIMLTTMRQLLDFMAAGGWHLAFDFVIDGVMPKKSKSLSQPNFIHQTGVYLTRPGVRSAFSRKRRQRSDVFEANGYWPTIFHAPRQNVQVHGHAKNAQAIMDIMGSFDVMNVVDPFLGSGTSMLAAFELGLCCTGIEKDRKTFDETVKSLHFMCLSGMLEIIQ